MNVVPCPELAVDPHAAAALLDDPVDRREAEARAVPERLRGEERLEDVRERLGVHADAGVADGEHHVRADDGVGVLGDVLLVELDVRRVDREQPAVGHRVARVDGEVHEDLLELVRVGEHGIQGRRERRDELDVLADQSREHRRQAGDDVVQLEHARLQDLPPAESEELTGEDGRALGGGRDLVELGLGRAVAAFEQRLGVAADHGQEVVEVVGDAAGEPPDRLELLRLAQLLLELACAR